MAAPNLVSPTTIYGKSIGVALTTSNVDLLTNTAASGKVLKINSIYVSNTDGTNNGEVTLTWTDASPAGTFNLASTIAVPADATLVVVDKDAYIYLEEGDKISGLRSAAATLQITISYEEIS